MGEVQSNKETLLAVVNVPAQLCFYPVGIVRRNVLVIDGQNNRSSRIPAPSDDVAGDRRDGRPRQVNINVEADVF